MRSAFRKIAVGLAVAAVVLVSLLLPALWGSGNDTTTVATQSVAAPAAVPTTEPVELSPTPSDSSRALPTATKAEAAALAEQAASTDASSSATSGRPGAAAEPSSVQAAPPVATAVIVQVSPAHGERLGDTPSEAADTADRSEAGQAAGDASVGADPEPSSAEGTDDPADADAGDESASGSDADLGAAEAAEPTAVATPAPTATTEPTAVPTPQPSPTPEPTATAVPEPTATPTPEPTPEPTPTPTPEPEPVDDDAAAPSFAIDAATMYVTASDGLFLRDEPAGQITDVLTYRSEVHATGVVAQTGDRLWLELDTPSQGWVAFAFLSTDQPAPPPESTTPSVPSEPPTAADWAAFRDCESGGRYDAVDPSGLYHGAYQFLPSTWDGLARRFWPELVGVLPSAAAPADQDRIAFKLFELEGVSPWPTCGQHLL